MLIPLREAIRWGLMEALDKDPRVFLMGEDIGEYGGAYAITNGLLKKYGEKRVKDTPISEAGFVGAAVGAAAADLRPIVELMSISFSLVAFDQIVNMAANIRYMSGGQISVPLVIRAPTGAGVQLAATHSQSFETWLAEVPGMKCVCPSNPYDALGLLRSAINDPNPVFFAEPAILYGYKGNVPEDYYEIPLGKAHVTREGEDLTMVSYGAGMRVILAVADMLEGMGKTAEVIDLRSLNPLDIDTIVESVRKTNRLLALDTSRRCSGVMATVVAEVQEHCFDWLDAPALRIGAADVPWPYNRTLEKASLPQAVDVMDALRRSWGIDNETNTRSNRN